jgi:hypothetical protein
MDYLGDGSVNTSFDLMMPVLRELARNGRDKQRKLR